MLLDENNRHYDLNSPYRHGRWRRHSLTPKKQSRPGPGKFSAKMKNLKTNPASAPNGKAWPGAEFSG